jgi:hypothetical protein
MLKPHSPATKPDYALHDPKGWCGDPRRGAAMGRGHYLDEPDDFDGKIYIREINLSSGGYDSNGTYFGHGDPLYWVASSNCSIDYVVRAADRAIVETQVRERWPLAWIKSSRSNAASLQSSTLS